ncbi:immunity protein TriTu family protein [Brevibacillus sp. SYSU BS000544]|uniref:immunity protein TriTu family protein n=1 Tax=Brevibacillus sp. SYSU BS000544 TaxID=3416443 RepID=UPI003CE5119A
MNDVFLRWIKEREIVLRKMGIKTEVNFQWDRPEHAINPSTVIDQETSLCVGRIIVWSSMHMHFQVFVLESDSVGPLLDKTVELADEPNFHNLLDQYFRVLTTGIVD